MSLLRFAKQPGETLDYLFDFTQWIPAGDTITVGAMSSSPSGLTLGVNTIEGGVMVRQFISGGTDGTTYEVTCQITTTQGRVKDASMLLQVSVQ